MYTVRARLRHSVNATEGDGSGMRTRGGEGVGLEEWMLRGEFEAAGMSLRASSGGGGVELGELGRKSGRDLAVIDCSKSIDNAYELLVVQGKT
jgi:hypothetical protein